MEMQVRGQNVLSDHSRKHKNMQPNESMNYLDEMK